jgi:hypothetical protein
MSEWIIYLVLLTHAKKPAGVMADDERILSFLEVDIRKLLRVCVLTRFVR